MSELNPFSQDSGGVGDDGDPNNMYAAATYESLDASAFQDPPAFGDADVANAQSNQLTFNEPLSAGASPGAASSPTAGNGEVPSSSGYGSALGVMGDGGGYSNSDDAAFQRNVSAAAGSNDPNSRSYRDREFNLDERERKLDAREADLNRRVNELEGELKDRGPRPNWPLPRIYEVSYHDIGAEIPPQFKALCRTMYTLWWGSAILVWYNWILITCGIAAGVDGSSVLAIVFALVYAFATSTLAWKGWYRNLYFAFRDSKTRKWLQFFLFFGLFLAWMIMYVLGVPGTGILGIIKMLDEYSARNNAYATAILAHSILASLILGVGVIMIIRLHRLYRSSGVHAQAKKDVKKELVKEAVNNSSLTGI